MENWLRKSLVAEELGGGKAWRKSWVAESLVGKRGKKLGGKARESVVENLVAENLGDGKNFFGGETFVNFFFVVDKVGGGKA